MSPQRVNNSTRDKSKKIAESFYPLPGLQLIHYEAVREKIGITGATLHKINASPVNGAATGVSASATIWSIFRKQCTRLCLAAQTNRSHVAERQQVSCLSLAYPPNNVVHDCLSTQNVSITMRRMGLKSWVTQASVWLSR